MQPNAGLHLGVRAFVRSVSHVKVLVASLFGRLAVEYCVARCLQGLITPQIRGVVWRFVTNSARGRPVIVLPRHASGLLRVSCLDLMEPMGLTGRHGPQARLVLASLASIVG